MASIVKSLGIEGVEGYLVDVEIKTIFGQPIVSIVSLGDMAIKEAKERIVAVYSAIINSPNLQIFFPRHQWGIFRLNFSEQ